MGGLLNGRKQPGLARSNFVFQLSVYFQRITRRGGDGGGVGWDREPATSRKTECQFMETGGGKEKNHGTLGHHDESCRKIANHRRPHQTEPISRPTGQPTDLQYRSSAIIQIISGTRGGCGETNQKAYLATSTSRPEKVKKERVLDARIAWVRTRMGTTA